MSRPDPSGAEPASYVHGHHESVLRSHTWRTIANSAAYLEPHLQPGTTVLDVGCGPGNLTAEMAGRVAPGGVVGVDASTIVIERAAAEHGEAVRFVTGDVHALDFADDTFDVVHAHQVLQHLSDPVGALIEMRRVARPGGIIAVRDADYGGMYWAPAEPALDRWMEIYQAMTVHNRQQADAGRHLLGWFQQAGFADAAMTVTSSVWTFADPASRTWWSELWADRVVESSFRTQALDLGLSDETELARIAEGWRRWAASADGYFLCPHGEVLALA